MAGETLPIYRSCFVALADVNAYQSGHNLSANDVAAIGDLDGDGALTNADIQAMIYLLIPAKRVAPRRQRAAPTAAPVGAAELSADEKPSDGQASPSVINPLVPLPSKSTIQLTQKDSGQLLSLPAFIPMIATSALDDAATESIASGFHDSAQPLPQSAATIIPITTGNVVRPNLEKGHLSFRTVVVPSQVDDVIRPLMDDPRQPRATDSSLVHHLTPRNRSRDNLSRDEVFSDWPCDTAHHS